MSARAADAFSIVINYRRGDTAGHAGRLYDALAARFGHDHVFMDIDAIEPGEDFVRAIEDAVGSCDVFISLIGREWLAIADEAGRRRLDNPGDYVRIEIEAALTRDVRVIPVLVEEAEMPEPDELPPSLAPLARRNAFELHDGSWRHDVERFLSLLASLEAELRTGRPTGDRPPAPAGRPRGRLLVLGAVALALAAAITLGAILLGRGGDEDGASNAAPPARDRIAFDEGGRIHVIGSDGESELTLRGTGFAVSPDWSPDGDALAFSRRGDIWVAAADGQDARRMTSGTEIDASAAWSPDGTRIAFDRHVPGGRADVWIVNADGSSVEEVTVGADATGAQPAWSPDGSRIAFQRRFRIWVMAADGSGATPISDDVPGAHLFPAWSPDGTRIAFVLGGTGSGCRIALVRPDGTDPITLEPEQLDRCADPAWSPDAGWLALAGDDGLWVLDRSGETVEQVRPGAGVGNPSWTRAP